MAGDGSALKDIAKTLARVYPGAEPNPGPFHFIVWENCGYLVDDTRRAEVFDGVSRKTGLDAGAIAKLSAVALTKLLQGSGLYPEKRAARLKEIAGVIDAQGGDLTAILAALPLPKARAFLKSFPAVADAGADRMLLFADVAPQAALDSNGLRVFVRLGLAKEHSSYSTTYREAVNAVREHGSAKADWLKQLYYVMRMHGKTLCKRTPLCSQCPLEARCPKMKITRL